MKYLIWALMYAGLLARLVALGLLILRRDAEEHRRLVERYVCLAVFMGFGVLRTGWLLWLRHTEPRAYNTFLSDTSDAMTMLQLAATVEAFVRIVRHFRNFAVFGTGLAAFCGLLAWLVGCEVARRLTSYKPPFDLLRAQLAWELGIALFLGMIWLFLRNFRAYAFRANARWNFRLLWMLFAVDAIANAVLYARAGVGWNGAAMVLMQAGVIAAGLGWGLMMRPDGERLGQ